MHNLKNVIDKISLSSIVEAIIEITIAFIIYIGIFYIVSFLGGSHV